MTTDPASRFASRAERGQSSEASSRGKGLRDGLEPFELAPCIIYIHDVATRRPLYVNGQAAKTLGYTPEELLSTAAQGELELVHPDDRDRLNAHLAGFANIADDSVHEVSYRMRDKNDVWRWFLSYDRSYKRARNGKVDQVLGVAIEIRDKQAPLHEERARLKFVLAAVRIGDWDLNLATGEMRTSLRHDQCFGASAKLDSWSYETFLSYVHPEDREGIKALFQKAVAEQGSWDFECRVIWPDNSVHWIAEHGSHYLTEEGKPSHMLGVVQDISERKLREELLQSLTAQLTEQKMLTEMALTAGDIGIWSLDLEKGVISYDETCQALFNLDPSMTYEAAFARIYPEDIPNVQEKLEAAFDLGGQSKFSEEFRLVVPGGSPKWNHSRGMMTFSGEGEDKRAVRFVGTMQDITEWKSTELELADLTQQLETRVQERTQEVQTLAAELTLTEQAERQKLAKTLHDTVQQELYAVQFNLAALRKDLEGRQAAVKLEESLELLLKTIQMTRQVATDLRPATLDEIDLCVSLRWLIDSVQRKYGLEVDFTEIDGCDIDNPAMRSLLFNLASELLFNVVKHAETNRATLTLILGDEMLELCVEDTGKGFDTQTRAETHGDAATGLGLSGAHKRLELFGGQLQVESTPGKGSTITVLIPRSSLELK